MDPREECEKLILISGFGVVPQQYPCCRMEFLPKLITWVETVIVK